MAASTLSTSSTATPATTLMMASFFIQLLITCVHSSSEIVSTTEFRRGTFHDFPTPSCNGSRPEPKDRRFNSTAVEDLIASFKPRFKDPIVAQMFENTLPNCLDTTVAHTNSSGIPDTFVITGDIDAMWLRDSTNQLMPYIALAKDNTKLKTMLCGAINRQASQVTTNRYANAFNIEPSPSGHHDDAVTTVPFVDWASSGFVFENKYELNSLVNVLKLSTAYYAATDDVDCFKSNPRWLASTTAIVNTIVSQQASTSEDFDSASYTFSRTTTVASDTLINTGHGHPAKRCGLSKSYFRASDDAVDLPFNIADNAYASVQLKATAPLLSALGQPTLAAKAKRLGEEIDDAIKSHGTRTGNTDNTSYFLYEVDGYGNGVFMDDANIPSLLSLPYLGYVARDDPTYLETRRRVLSNHTNPWFFSGSAGEGVGGPHIGTNYIWPMSITMRALTSNNETEISECLHTLISTTANTLFVHESFDQNNAAKFTRPWFSWANSLFAELIIQLSIEHPQLIFKQ